MKTTIEIADTLFEEAKQTARARGITMKELFEEGLRRAIQERTTPKAPFRLRDGSVTGEPTDNELSWPEIRRIIYEGRGE